LAARAIAMIANAAIASVASHHSCQTPQAADNTVTAAARLPPDAAA
jgi:hypothetical protein